jgi:hypothetical protein
MKPLPHFTLAALLLISSFAEATDGANDARGLGLFHDYVEPMLKQQCFKCHSHEAQKAKGGLVLDSRNAML